VDGQGILDHDRMRTNIPRHPGMAGPRIAMLPRGEGPYKYLTRLRDGKVEADHDEARTLMTGEDSWIRLASGNRDQGVAIFDYEMRRHARLRDLSQPPAIPHAPSSSSSDVASEGERSEGGGGGGGRHDEAVRSMATFMESVARAGSEDDDGR
jgi:hypothetical protein